MKKTTLLLTALAFGALPLPASAQQPVDSGEQQRRENAVTYLHVLIGGLESENVDQEVKNILMGCIYGNSLRDITEQMDRAFDANPSIDRTDPSQILGVLARVCGHRSAGTQPPASGAQAR